MMGHHGRLPARLRLQRCTDDVRLDAAATHGADQTPRLPHQHLGARGDGRGAAHARHRGDRAGCARPGQLGGGTPDVHLAGSSSSRATARRRCGITIDPPTTRATANASKNSGSVTPSSRQRTTWYVTQSSQRSTIEATRPSNSFVFTGRAPVSYVRVSSAKKRLMLTLPASRIAAFIFSRKCRKASIVLGASV